MSCRDASLAVNPFTVFEGGPLMFDNHCAACDKRLLIFPSQVTSMVNTEAGIVVAYTCWCGSAQTWLTGSKAVNEVAVGLAA